MNVSLNMEGDMYLFTDIRPGDVFLYQDKVWLRIHQIGPELPYNVVNLTDDRLAGLYPDVRVRKVEHDLRITPEPNC